MERFNKKVSIVFPAYNEEDSVRLCVTRAYDVLDKMLESFEIIIVNDGSIDSTSKICQELQNKFDKIKVISKEKNEGYGYAVRDGIDKANYELVFFSDSDGQFDLANLGRLLKYIDDYEIVIGYREKRLDPFIRKIFCWGYSVIIRKLFGLPVKDINCAFKLFNKRIFGDINIESKDYLINLEILIKARDLGLNIKQIPVSHFPRHKGKSKIKISDIPRTIKGIAKLYKSIKK